MTGRPSTVIEHGALPPPADAERLGRTPADTPVEVSFVLRASNGATEASGGRAGTGPRLADVTALLGWALKNGLELEDLSPIARTITLCGPAERWGVALDAELWDWASEGVAFRGPSSGVSMAADVAEAIVGLAGLDTRPVASHAPVVPVSESLTVSPLQLAAAYRLPVGADGTGECIGVIELGGALSAGDLVVEAMRYGLGVPDLVTVPTGSLGPVARTTKGLNDQLDVAVALDTQVAATIAPGCRLAVYTAPNTAQGLLEAVTVAIADDERRPSVLVVNWASAEQDGLWTTSAMRALDSLFEIAMTRGITVLADTSLAGDALTARGADRISYPASSPHVVACASSAMVISTRGVESDMPWTAAGSHAGAGTSVVFESPMWQQAIQAFRRSGARRRRGRATPDVSAHGAGYLVTVGGSPASVGGGGAGASVWAGIVALLNQALGRRVGALMPELYRAADSGEPRARQWDRELGLGAPDGASLQLIVGRT